MPPQKPDDLDWLAFRYIADELSPDETEAFETRLAKDQKAREAVADAVDLSRAVAAAMAERPMRTTPVLGTTRTWRRTDVARRLGWAAAAVAACLVAVWAYRVYRDGPPTARAPQALPGKRDAETPQSRPERLVVFWSEARDDLAALQSNDWPPGSVDLSEELLPPPEEDHSDEELFADNVPPTWMLAAVRAATGGPGNEEFGDSSPQEN